MLVSLQGGPSDKNVNADCLFGSQSQQTVESGEWGGDTWEGRELIQEMFMGWVRGLVPLGISESQCRMHLSYSTQRVRKLGYFSNTIPAIPFEGHFRVVPLPVA